MPSGSAVPLVIRRYESGDADACRRLWGELTEWHRQLYGDPTIGGADPGRRFDSHLQAVGPANIWVAQRETGVVGLAAMIDRGDGTAELEPLVVSEPFRGRGLGRLLAEAVIAEARTRGMRRIVVRPVGRNESAVRLFRSAGFNVLGRLELQLEFHEDRIVRRPAAIDLDNFLF